MSTPRVIGVLGGMGPAATVDLMARVIRATPALDDAGHVPMIVAQNTQVPSRIATLIEGQGEDPLPVLIKTAQDLQAAGAEALAMPCNTAHHYVEQIAAAVDIPFLHMIALTGEAVQGRPGILGSPALQRVGVFEKAMPGALYPSDPDALLAAIRDIKANGPTDAARTALKVASGDLAAQGADTQVIACTEFSLIADEIAAPSIDTLDILTDAIVAFSIKG
ncbi:amino acid racemase [Cognatishimia sp. MH4019]|uniref:aspartate/glutamate racemase family protein n=1 Tax=Cognatishimia sp. MH4019 TaxID=2854030 RepID=UPI001CD63857